MHKTIVSNKSRTSPKTHKAKPYSKAKTHKAKTHKTKTHKARKHKTFKKKLYNGMSTNYGGARQPKHTISTRRRNLAKEMGRGSHLKPTKNIYKSKQPIFSMASMASDIFFPGSAVKSFLRVPKTRKNPKNPIKSKKPKKPKNPNKTYPSNFIPNDSNVDMSSKTPSSVMSVSYSNSVPNNSIGMNTASNNMVVPNVADVVDDTQLPGIFSMKEMASNLLDNKNGSTSIDQDKIRHGKRDKLQPEVLKSAIKDMKLAVYNSIDNFYLTLKEKIQTLIKTHRYTQIVLIDYANISKIMLSGKQNVFDIVSKITNKITENNKLYIIIKPNFGKNYVNETYYNGNPYLICNIECIDNSNKIMCSTAYNYDESDDFLLICLYDMLTMSRYIANMSVTVKIMSLDLYKFYKPTNKSINPTDKYFLLPPGTDKKNIFTTLKPIYLSFK